MYICIITFIFNLSRSLLHLYYQKWSIYVYYERSSYSESFFPFSVSKSLIGLWKLEKLVFETYTYTIDFDYFHARMNYFFLSLLFFLQLRQILFRLRSYGFYFNWNGILWKIQTESEMKTEQIIWSQLHQ